MKPEKKSHYGNKPLFSMANAGRRDLVDNNYKKVAAWFLGPKGENRDLLLELVRASIDEHAHFRQSYMETDPVYIDDDIRQSPEYQDACSSLLNIRRELSEKLHKSVPFFSFRYQAHMNWDTVIPATVGYITAMLYNQNNVATEGGPETCALEKEVGEELCALMGYPDQQAEYPSWGHITADGTIANIESMWMARNLKFFPLAIREMLIDVPELQNARDQLEVSVYEKDDNTITNILLVNCSIWQLLNLDSHQSLGLVAEITRICKLEDGAIDKYLAPFLIQNRGLVSYAQRYPETANVRILVPATKHYSWPKAGTLLGLGQDSVIGIPVDDRCRMDIKRLRQELDDCYHAERPVLMVVAVIGSTEEGVVDDLDGVLNLRREFPGLSFLVHCDAAWGGYLRTMLMPPEQGVDRSNDSESGFVPDIALSAHAQKQYGLMYLADTITVDPHKAGFVPYPAGSLCYRDGRLRSLITFNASYIHSAEGLNMGIFGLEGSKPGAAAAAVWMAHKAIPLDSTGYGQILGECTFTTKLYYCYWLTLFGLNDDFRIEPLIPLPDQLYGRSGNVIAEGRESILDYIRQHIIDKTNEELAYGQPDALSVLQQLGSDVLINAFVVNFRINGEWNRELGRLNQFNQEIFNRFSITSPDQPGRDQVEFILTESQLDSDHYHVPLMRISQELNLNVPVEPYAVNFLINTTLQPWPSTCNFISVIMNAFSSGLREISGGW